MPPREPIITEALRKQVIDQFLHNATRRNTLKIIHTANVEGTQEIIHPLASCRREHPCESPFCPNCGPRRQSKAAYLALDAIYLALRRWPDRSEFSWVTIRVGLVGTDEEAVNADWTQARKRFENVRARYFPDTAWIGSLDISLSGYLHLHVVIYHPTMSRNDLRKRLLQFFPGRSGCHVRPPKTDIPTPENLETLFRYAFEKRPRPPGEFSHIPRNELPEYIARRLILMSRMLKRGYQKCRVFFGRRVLGPVTSLSRSTSVAHAERARRKAKRDARRRPRTPWADKNLHLR